MEISEKNLPLAQEFIFRRERLLHFHDHLSLPEKIGRVVDDFCSSRNVIGIGITRPQAGIFLDEHSMTALGQLIRGGRQEANPVFLLLNLFRYADDHLEEVISDE